MFFIRIITVNIIGFFINNKNSTFGIEKNQHQKSQKNYISKYNIKLKKIKIHNFLQINN